MTGISEYFPHIVHVGAMLHLVAFAFRNQLVLRGFAIAGSFAYSLYYLVGAGETALWSPMFWSVMSILINIVLIIIIVGDSRQSGFSDDELKLFRKLDKLSPRDFRHIARAGKWHRAAGETVLTEEGKPLNSLYYVLDGTVAVEKAGRIITPGANLFVGEIAFLLGRQATATVKIGAGSQYIEWRGQDLHQLFKKQPALKGTFASLLNADMAEKVARS
jgi:CRP-like cAMP-binding protein